MPYFIGIYEIEHRFPKPGVASSNLAGGIFLPSKSFKFPCFSFLDFYIDCQKYRTFRFFRMVGGLLVGFFNLGSVQFSFIIGIFFKKKIHIIRALAGKHLMWAVSKAEDYLCGAFGRQGRMLFYFTSKRRNIWIKGKKRRHPTSKFSVS